MERRLLRSVPLRSIELLNTSLALGSPERKPSAVDGIVSVSLIRIPLGHPKRTRHEEGPGPKEH